MRPTSITTDKTKNQAFLLLGRSALCLLTLVPALMIGAYVATDHGTRRIIALCAFVPLALGLGFAAMANRLLSGKTKSI